MSALSGDATRNTDQSVAIEYLTQGTSFHNCRHTVATLEILVRIMGMGIEAKCEWRAAKATSTRYCWLCVSKYALHDNLYLRLTLRQCSSGANVSTINLVFEVTNLKARTESGARSTLFDKGASIVAMQELGAVIGMWLHSTGTWRTSRLQWLLLQA